MTETNDRHISDNIVMNTLTSASRHERSRSRAKSPVPQRRDSQPLDSRDYAVGILLLLVVVFLWTAGNFLTQDLYLDGYAKPFLVTYLNTASFSLYLIPFLLRRLWKQRFGAENNKQRGRNNEGAREEYEPLVGDPDDLETGSTSMYNARSPIVSVLDASQTNAPPLTTQETASLAFVFCFFWFIANWSLNASLDYTSVASSTILSSMSGFFTLGIGRLFHVETLTIGKICAVLTSFGGVILVSVSDSSQQPQPGASLPSRALSGLPTDQAMLGDTLALLSAVFYALYVILLKVRIGQESRIDMQLFFGFVGLFNVLACWPIGLILHFVGIEKLELPTHSKTITFLLVNMSLTLLSDYIYVLAMLKTTPLVVTIGLSLTIPVAVMGDFFFGRQTKGVVIFGAILVLISFVTVGYENSRTEDSADILQDTEAVIRRIREQHDTVIEDVSISSES